LTIKINFMQAKLFILGLVLLFAWQTPYKALSDSLLGGTKTPKDIYRDNKDSVLLVIANESNNKFASGTGFAIDNEGHFLTAAHVIEDAKEIILLDREKNAYKVYEVNWVDKDLDIAILDTKVKNHFKALPLKTYTQSEIGENLTIISYPKGSEIGGIDSTLSQGLLSSVRNNFVSERSNDFSPVYDKANPQIHKSISFYKNLQKNCETISEKENEGLKLMRCADGHLVVLDKKRNNSVVYDNFDIAFNIGNLVYYYTNKNTKYLESRKTIGTMLQYTTPISTGSSGGPIFNEKGEVIAIVNSYLEDAQNVNFGRPIDYLPNEFKDKNIFALQNPVNFIANAQPKESIKKPNCSSVNLINLNETMKIAKCSENEFQLIEETSLKNNSYEDLLLQKFSVLTSETNVEPIIKNNE
jgi:Trypsin-like peptidase domain